MWVPKDKEEKEMMLLKEKISKYGVRCGMDIYSDSELIAMMLNITVEDAESVQMQDPIASMDSIKGIGSHKTMMMEAINEYARRKYECVNKAITNIKRPDDAYLFIKDKLQYEKKEHLGMILLTTKHDIIKYVDVSVGDISFTIANPREIFYEAIKAHAADFILVHNHPSGNPLPSDEDVRVTKNIIDAGKILKIPVLDHIIIGRNSYESIRNKHILNFEK